MRTFPIVALRCAYEEKCLSSSADEMFNNIQLARAWFGHSRRVMRFSAKVHNVGTAAYRPYLTKNAWKWHTCHAHFHSDEEFAFYDLIGKYLVDSIGKRTNGHFRNLKIQSPNQVGLSFRVS